MRGFSNVNHRTERASASGTRGACLFTHSKPRTAARSLPQPLLERRRGRRKATAALPCSEQLDSPAFASSACPSVLSVLTRVGAR